MFNRKEEWRRIRNLHFINDKQFKVGNALVE